MKIAYFHRLTFEDTELRFKEEAEKMGIELVFIKYKDLILESNFALCHPERSEALYHTVRGEGSRDMDSSVSPQNDNSNKITFNGIDTKDFDIWFIRSVGSELEWSKLLQLYARDNNIPVVDDYILTEGVLKRFKSTMGYILAKAGILYPKTIYFNTFKQVKKYLVIEEPCSSHPDPSEALYHTVHGKGSRGMDSSVSPQNDEKVACSCGENCGCSVEDGCSIDIDVIAIPSLSREKQSDISYPFIIKMSSGGRHGMSTFFIQKESDLFEMENTLKDRKEKAIKEGKTVPVYKGFLLQEYIPNDGDFRVMTVGYKCIGGFKRAPKEEKLVLNKSKGKSTGIQKLPDDVVKTSEQAGKVLGIEIAGTDLVRHKDTGEVYVVEVNEAPQFKVFEKRTGVNAPKLILDYLVNKSKK